VFPDRLFCSLRRKRIDVRSFTFLLSFMLLGAVSAPHPLSIVFDAPAGGRPAGPIGPLKPYAQILPSGRIVDPLGENVVVGMNALGLALTPDGRYAIVSNDDERQIDTVSALDFTTRGGYSLAVVDTRTMRVVDRYRNDEEQFSIGVVALRDPADPAKTLVLASGGPSNTVYALDLDANGHLLPDVRHRISMPLPTDAAFADVGHAFPATIALSRDGSRAYVVNKVAGSVSTIDTKMRTVLGISPNVGFSPYGVAIAGGRVVVTNEGLMRYTKLAAPQAVPEFTNPVSDLEQASSLSMLELATDGSFAGPPLNLPMDQTPDGISRVGGAHPSAIVVSPNGTYAYITMSNVDRIATVLLGPVPQVVGGTELRLYAHSPYGTQPNALALSRDGKRLYVALAGINAVAVLDASEPRRLHRVGLLPTGWFPSALALSSDDRYLFVTNAKGFNHDRGFQGDFPLAVGGDHILEVGADDNAVWATLQRIDLQRIDVRKTTRAVLSYQHVTRVLVPHALVPQVFAGKGSAKIKHVVMILEEGKTYDAMLGDLTDDMGHAYGPGDPTLIAYDRNTTPNLHALARTFGLAGNFYADAEEANAGQQFALGGIANTYTEKTLLLGQSAPLIGGSQSPEAYARAGYIFNSLAARKMAYRDYGALLRLSGYNELPIVERKGVDTPMDGLGGTYALNVPGLAALAGHVDLQYPIRNTSDTRRAEEFIRDIDPLVKNDSVPTFISIWLPGNHGAIGKKAPSLTDQVADSDRALGMIVEYVTHAPQWRQTAIFIASVDTQSTRDHINVHRGVALVVSPYAKRRYISARHLSTASVLKTVEEILGLPALSLGDMLAGDMHDFFTTGRFDLTPFTHLGDIL
jgi:YVTN family beta-propeller protein